MQSLASFVVLAVLCTHVAAMPAAASSYAGSTSSAVYPPAGASLGLDAEFPDATQVGYAGPTPSTLIGLIISDDSHSFKAGDEAYAVETAPSISQMESEYPLVKPNPSGGSSSNFDVLQHVGNLSPWQSVSSFGLPGTSAKIPPGCSLTQVHLLHRHGARYPTSDAAPAKFAAHINAVASTGQLSASGALSFLNTWTYKLGAEILTPFGREQL